ncbi:MAG: hypothetical protein V4671_14145, partial [Armatimonadota bacterium]
TQLLTHHHTIRINGITHSLSDNGTQVLDSTFGYYPEYPDVFPSNGFQYVASDSPSQGYEYPAEYVEVLDSFLTYTLYVPPGDDSVFVPLKNLQWFYEGEAATDPLGIWSVYNTAAAWSLGDDFPSFPTWNSNSVNAVWNPPLP